MIIPAAKHVGLEEVPWVPNPGYPGTELRLLQADVETGLYVMAGRLPAGLNVGRHHHTGAVHMFTLSGAWGYREHDFVNRAGSYLYEPPDSIHTLYTPEDNAEVTESMVSDVDGRRHALIDLFKDDLKIPAKTRQPANFPAGLPQPERPLANG